LDASLINNYLPKNIELRYIICMEQRRRCFIMKTTATFTGIFFLLLLSFSCAEAAVSFNNVSTHYLAPFTPNGAAIADFNGDGYQDAAVTIYDNSTGYLKIFLGSSTGALTFSADLPTGSKAQSDPRGIVAADLNRDGKIDLAVANFADNSVSVFLNNGNATFTRSDYPLAAGTGPIALAVGDFRGDGTRDDLAVLNSTGNSIAILLNNGAGGMALQSSLSTTGAPLAIAVGDFNGDDIDDIAVTPNALGHVTVFKGSGVGTFAAGSDIAAGNGPTALVAADFNNDGITDLAVLNSTGGTISIIQGNSGALTVNNTYPVSNPTPPTPNPVAMVAVDLNRDGILDLAVADKTNNSISVLTGHGDATFIPATASDIFSTGTGPTGLASGDFNNSNGNDLLSISGSSNNSYSVLLNSSPVVAGLTVLPGRVDFGNFAIGHQMEMDKVLTLFNGGSAPLTIASASTSGVNSGDFLAVANSCSTTTPTIVPGSSCTLLARFKNPISEGAKSANLNFSSNAAFVPAVVVPLSGAGIPDSTKPYTIKVSFLGRGGGTVTFSSLDPSCVSPTTCSCTPTVPTTSLPAVTLTALPDTGTGSLFYGWTGCDSLNGTSCVINYSANMTSDHNLTVNFGVVPRLVRNYTSSTYTSTVAQACNNAGGGIIQIVSGLFAEDLNLVAGGALEIHGGYESSFTTQGAATQLRSLTIAAGSAVLDNIVLH
jgi:hypothetical protein